MPTTRITTVCTLVACAVAALALTPRSAPANPERISFMRSPVLVTAPAPSPSSGGVSMVERRKDGHYWASAETKGVTLDLLVDTGASKVVLTEQDARRIGINTYALDFDGTATTANGTVETAHLSIDRLRIGSVTVRDVPTLVTKGNLDTSLLGMSFLGALDSFEFKGDNLILRQ